MPASPRRGVPICVRPRSREPDRGLCRARQVPPSAVCPECRQRNVFQGAILLKKLGDTIAHRCDTLMNFSISHRPVFTGPGVTAR